MGRFGRSMLSRIGSGCSILLNRTPPSLTTPARYYSIPFNRAPSFIQYHSFNTIHSIPFIRTPRQFNLTPHPPPLIQYSIPFNRTPLPVQLLNCTPPSSHVPSLSFFFFSPAPTTQLPSIFLAGMFFEVGQALPREQLGCYLVIHWATLVKDWATLKSIYSLT